jgi:protein SCO1/2
MGGEKVQLPHRSRAAGLLLALALLVGGSSSAPGHPTGDGVTSDAGGQGDHTAHGHGRPGGYVRGLESYAIPDVTLVGQGGERVALSSLFESKRPVMLNFIFTTCTTICPVMTATFASVQRELGEERGELQLVSISIDPEHDTPARLASYARHQHALEPWRFLTGEAASIRTVQEAFRAYRGDKMNHVPLTFLRASPDEPWLRIEGFATSADLVREYRGLVGD